MYIIEIATCALIVLFRKYNVRKREWLFKVTTFQTYHYGWTFHNDQTH